MQLLSILLLSFFELISIANTTAEITFVGDAMQHGPQISAAYRNGTYDYSSCFTLLQPDIQNVDYAVVNLECPLAGKPYSGYPQFSAPDEYAQQLKASGFDLFLTANNHCLDSGDKGLVRTCNTLTSMGVPHAGTYVNNAERSKKVPFITDIKGIKIAFLNYTYGTNGLRPKTDIVVDYINKDKMSADIDKARENGAEMICVAIHWGIEYQSLPSHSQCDIADFLTDKGVDLIIGSHPHVIQPMEVRNNSKYGKQTLVVYSLGNFISNQTDVNSRGGAMVKVRLYKYNNKAQLLGASYGLFFCQKPVRPIVGDDNYKLIPADLPNQVRADSRSTFNQFIRNSRALFNKYNKYVYSFQ